ncbi:hypothetical protein HPB51_010329 [Rhipicephalus microplus]|uniref:Uncharacterized protein n=1 Tax=Rhipicephalus microplus TaxID=6941 RepID=A0A9J6DG23_RHIMP|nr:hypothetical protein HPB51_010329 [Rhipicephalus microplus]
MMAACVMALTTALLTLQDANTLAHAHAHRAREVQTYLVINHPPVKTAAQGRTADTTRTAAASGGGGHHAAASSISTSYGYQLHRETNHHVPVLITTGHVPLLARAPAHKTYVTVQHLHHAVHHVHQPLVLLPPQPHLPIEVLASRLLHFSTLCNPKSQKVHYGRRDRLSAQSSSFRHKHNPYVRLPDYPAYLSRNAVLSLEDLAEAEAEPTLKVYRADAEYPPLNMRNRRKLYSLGYIYMLDFLENSYLKR